MILSLTKEIEIETTKQIEVETTKEILNTIHILLT